MSARRIRLAFWLHVMDVVAYCGGYGSRAYYWAVRKAADCEEWPP